MRRFPVVSLRMAKPPPPSTPAFAPAVPTARRRPLRPHRPWISSHNPTSAATTATSHGSRARGPPPPLPRLLSPRRSRGRMAAVSHDSCSRRSSARGTCCPAREVAKSAAWLEIGNRLDMVYAKDADGEKDFRGVYCTVLTTSTHVVSAAILEVRPEQVAELALIATRGSVWLRTSPKAAKFSHFVDN